MKFLWQKLRTIVSYSSGSENIFGYKSTAANQLYLLYCCGGNIYFTDKIRKTVKYFWYGIVSCEILYSYLIAFEYLWYEKRNDLLLIMHVVNFVGPLNSIFLIFPLILYLYRDRIEAMIEHVDNMLSNRLGPDFKQNRILAESKKYLQLFLIPFLICYAVYMSLCIPDVVLFFEVEKIRNSIYYPFPPPKVQEYSSIWSFFIATGVISATYTIAVLQACSVFGLLLYWNAICCAQLIGIKNGLLAVTEELNIYSDDEVELSAEWNGVFDRLLKHSIEEFQNTTRIINYLRESLEAIGTLLITNCFWLGMTVLYTSYTEDILLLLKAKFLIGYMATLITVISFYWIGQNLNNTVSEVSLAVYSTPWYRSVKIQKTAYIFLCQTQSVKNFAVFKVYGLLFHNLSRYLHGQMSYINILRRFTMK